MMNTNPLSFSINAISNIVKTLTKKNYKQQLSETQRVSFDEHQFFFSILSIYSTHFENVLLPPVLIKSFYLSVFYFCSFSLIIQLINNIGFECERHLYRFLFEAILNTPQADTNKLNLFQQLYSDLGNLFDKSNFISIIQFSLQSSSLDQQNSKSTELAQRICDLCKCLKLSELQKLSIFICLNLFDFDQQIDLKKCKFQSEPQLTQFLLSKLLILADQEPKILDFLNLIKKGMYFVCCFLFCF